MSYVSPKEAIKFFGVSKETLRRWNIDGTIQTIKTNGGHRRYKIPEKDNNQGKKNIIYARVSSSKQKSDLENQIKFIKQKYPTYEVITDIGSGINYKRKGFKRILELLFEGNINEVVVAHSDRFTRFSFELFVWMFNFHGSTLLDLSNEESKSPEQELSEDLLSIITVFSARYYGKRKYSIL